MGAQLKIGSITFAHQKCTGCAGRLTHSSRSVMRHHSVGLESNAHSAKQSEDTLGCDSAADTSLIGPLSDVSQRDRLILGLHALRSRPAAEIIYATGAALPQSKVCITKTPSCPPKVNTGLGCSHTVMFNTFQDFCCDDMLSFVSSLQTP